jgi:hypothetical protein
MAETPLKPLKAILQTIREQADLALKQLHESEEERSMRWKCKDSRLLISFSPVLFAPNFFNQRGALFHEPPGRSEV